MTYKKEGLDRMDVLFKLSYNLRRFQAAGWSLERWLAGILLLLGLLGLLRWLPGDGLSAGVAASAAVALLGLGRWAQRRDYVHFTADHAPPPSARAMLPMSELIPVSASGRFDVEGESQRFTELPAHYQSFEIREHVIIGRVRPARFLFIGRWPEQDIGMWYIFIRPRDLLSVTSGLLSHGRRSRLALRLVIARPEEEEKRNSLLSARHKRDSIEVVFLSFDHSEDRQRVWVDLLVDAPQAGQLVQKPK
ncbi:hypothetical protein [Candidatus Amarolinea aalborgensis]|uniref:hypothetical protein n=1 Tax=Candidatus Amarolinea aalborgensis TaxID=2249329 RepID=UPI003BF9C082